MGISSFPCRKCGTSSKDYILTQISELDAFTLYDNDDPRVLLADVDTKTTQIETLLASLARQRTALKKRINQLDAPVIRILPAEVISEIFTFFSPPLSFNDPCSLNPVTRSLFLGSVCKIWREIAWSTPRLWNSVHLELSRDRLLSQELILDQWLSRAGSLPLSIRITCESSESMHWDLTPPTAIMEKVMLHAGRCHTLDFRLPLSTVDCLRSATGHFTTLTSLSILPPGGQTARSRKTDAFSIAPQLQHVKLYSIYLSATVLPWENVTHFEARHFYVDECLEVLRRAPNLVRCEFPTIVDGDDSYSITKAPIFLPHLRKLLLGVERRAEIAIIFDLITAPGLVDLQLNIIKCEIPHDSFTSFLDRSTCPLQRLSLLAPTLSHSQWMQYFQALPSLVHLQLDVSSLVEPISEALNNQSLLALTLPACSVSSTTSVLLPKLQTLEYSGPRFFTFRSLETVLRSRWDTYLLKSVSLALFALSTHEDKDLVSEIKSSLVKLQELGMKLTIFEGGVDVLTGASGIV
ncbi:hypothetical protein BDQ12DRAFT_433445 [Crucibulum laeve]|uniref:Uncharacterized protein n=1 Tax=Crucibulum laeve TaxID=68775 RepID=A0A5C3M752_9AGAR|nr:hypothetical protein BDQ12DRAFT_433445 [Crucibulum laeve]